MLSILGGSISLTCPAHDLLRNVNLLHGPSRQHGHSMPKAHVAQGDDSFAPISDVLRRLRTSSKLPFLHERIPEAVSPKQCQAVQASANQADGGGVRLA